MPLAETTLDMILLAGFRSAGKPIEESSVWRVVPLPSGHTNQDRQDSLARLVAAGLVTRRQITLRGHHAPLFDRRTVIAYEAVRKEVP